uniref:Uncharacterized protein n=1 Tax=Meloidogyne enterolobii TaxID=390850 RepID=A0A6V7W7Z9_MELEN|nr:unnamed protein product [Meloidogyne enterolobii]
MSNQTLFDIYGDRGLPFGLITVNVVRVVISTIGVLLNAAFVFVTIKIKLVLVTGLRRDSRTTKPGPTIQVS